MNNYKKHLLTFMGIAYASSLFLPGLILENDTYGPDVVTGFGLLLSGWLGFLAVNFAWFANPLLLIALFLSRSKKYYSSLFFSIAAFFIGFNSLTATEWYYNEGVATPVSGLGLAYYVWQTVLLLGVIYCFVNKNKITHHSPR